jgi:hypothetical protein
MDLRKTGSDNGRWIEQGQDRVQRWADISGVEPSGSDTKESVN